MDNLNKLLTSLTIQPLQQTPSEWAQHFSQQLSLLGWPGERTLNSEEYQQLNKWHELLATFASLDHIYAKLTLAGLTQNAKESAIDQSKIRQNLTEIGFKIA